MRLINKIAITIDGMLRNIIRNIIVISVLSLGILTLITGMYLRLNVKDYRIRIENVLSMPVKNISIMMEGSYVADVNNHKYIQDLLSEDEDCLCFGIADEGIGIDFERWIDFDDEIHRKYYGESKAIYANPGILEMCKPDLFDGSIMTREEIQKKYGELIGCYIGADYKGVIPVGTVFKDKMNRNDLIVLGHFKKGEKVIDQSVAYRISEDENKVDVLLDDKVVFVFDEEAPCDKYYIASKCSAEEFKDKLTRKAEERGLDFSLVTMDENIKDMENKNATLYDLYAKLFFLIMFVSVCMIFCFQIISINENNKRYGILLTNGYKSRDIVGMVVIENVIKYLLAFSIAFLFSYVKLYTKYKETFSEQGVYLENADLKLFDDLFIFRTIPICFLIGLIVVFTAIIVPMMYLRKRPAYEYLRDR